ncbi:MAG: MG2 domain-containing protein, partial [Pseudomonadota bacterium]
LGVDYTERGVYRAGETAHVSALVRTSDGAAANLPATLIVSRPDGVEYRRITLRDQGDGGRTHALQFDAAAMTGTWRMRLHVDPEAPAIAETAVLVEDFVPERLGLDLTTTAKTITPGEAVEIDVTGRYLYGPPAVDLAVEGEVVVAPAATETAFRGFSFGDSEAVVTPVRRALDQVARTGADGRTLLPVRLPSIPKTARALNAKVLIR